MSDDGIFVTACDKGVVHVSLKDEGDRWLGISLRCHDAEALAGKLMDAAREARKKDKFRAEFNISEPTKGQG